MLPVKDETPGVERGQKFQNFHDSKKKCCLSHPQRNEPVTYVPTSAVRERAVCALRDILGILGIL